MMTIEAKPKQIRIPARVPPEYWQQIKAPMPFMTAWIHKITQNMQVFRSLSTARGGSQWVHVSVSRPDRLPTWAELSKVKNDFMGDDIEAYQVLAAKSEHVNIHPNCLHLWAPVGGGRRVANLRDLVDEKPL